MRMFPHSYTTLPVPDDLPVRVGGAIHGSVPAIHLPEPIGSEVEAYQRAVAEKRPGMTAIVVSGPASTWILTGISGRFVPTIMCRGGAHVSRAAMLAEAYKAAWPESPNSAVMEMLEDAENV